MVISNDSFNEKSDDCIFMLMQQTNDVIESIMKNGVESGVIVNAPEPETSVPAPIMEAVK